jgi:hypothetical protein
MALAVELEEIRAQGGGPGQVKALVTLMISKSILESRMGRHAAARATLELCLQHLDSCAPGLGGKD